MFPVPPTWPLSNIEFYYPFIGNVLMACMYVGAAVLFINNLDVYKTKLRRAYIALALSIGVVGLGMLQISVIAALDLWRSPYVLGGGMMFPFLISGIIIYLAVRKIALLVRYKHIFNKWWLSLPFAFVTAYATSFLPHVPVTLEETGFDIGIAVITSAATLLFISGILVIGIRRHTGALYTSSMTWLARASFLSSVVLAVQCIYYLITTDYDHIVTRTNTIIAIISGFWWIRAGYTFALTKYYADDLSVFQFLVSQSESKNSNQPKTAIDMVTYAASLASNSKEIDPILDDVRAITATLQPGETPSASSTKRLVSAYLKIEHYLTTKEPARNYNQKELRAQLAPSLQKIITSQ